MATARTTLWILAALASAGASFLTVTQRNAASDAREPQRFAPTAGPAAAELARRIGVLREETRALREELEQRGDGAVELAPTPPGDQQIEAAFESWLARRLATVEASARLARTESPYADLSAADLLRLFTESDTTALERQLLWQAARESGQDAALLAMFEERAASAPDDPERANDLAQAYLQMRYGEPDITRGMEWAERADAQFARVLELDPDHWDARFAKARALSMWPPMMGKSGEAIRHLERLAAMPRDPGQTDRAEVFLTLGNLRLRRGDREGALAAWREGAAEFPLDERLRAQIDFLEGR